MPDTPIILCGTKTDLREEKAVLYKAHSKGLHVITKEEGEYMAEHCGCIG